ncbi:uncharacterized protein PG986_010600 [Apiospora aurea]|uniref:Uncharacterized protein n=1 Tax=Apiospora aurea TaxID=335848 RepID=A0ABR1Q2Q7_9PEZI
MVIVVLSRGALALVLPLRSLLFKARYGYQIQGVESVNKSVREALAGPRSCPQQASVGGGIPDLIVDDGPGVGIASPPLDSVAMLTVQERGTWHKTPVECRKVPNAKMQAEEMIAAPGVSPPLQFP